MSAALGVPEVVWVDYLSAVESFVEIIIFFAWELQPHGMERYFRVSHSGGLVWLLLIALHFLLLAAVNERVFGRGEYRSPRRHFWRSKVRLLPGSFPFLAPQYPAGMRLDVSVLASVSLPFPSALILRWE